MKTMYEMQVDMAKALNRTVVAGGRRLRKVRLIKKRMTALMAALLLWSKVLHRERRAAMHQIITNS